MNGDADFFPQRTHPVNREEDKRLILRYLYKNPLSSVDDLSCATGIKQNRCHKLLAELAGDEKEDDEPEKDDKSVVHATLGRAYNARLRYWMTAKSVCEVRDLTGCPIPWVSSEDGIKLKVSRLPMVEAANQVLPRLWAHQGVDRGRWVFKKPGPFRQLIQCTAELRIVDLLWRRKGDIDAVVLYEQGVWVVFVWVGSMMTEHMLKRKASRAMAQLQGQYTPTAWVLVGYDRLVARLAADCWPADQAVLAVSVDGYVERRMSPSDFTQPLMEQEEPRRLGEPERVVEWLREDDNQAMLALNGYANYSMFRIIGAWQDPTPRQLKRAFGDTYRAEVRALKEADLAEKENGVVKLTRKGRRTLAAMDRVSAQGIHRRSEKYLKEAGKYRSQQRRHNRVAIDAYVKIVKDGIDTYAGFHCLRQFTDAEGISRVSPDLVVCLDRADGTSLMVYVELELTDSSPSEIRGKLNHYLRLQALLGRPVFLLFIARDEPAERHVQKQGKELRMMLTTTLARLMAGSSWGNGSVWRTVDGETKEIGWLAEFADRVRDAQRDAEPQSGSDWDGFDGFDDGFEEPTWWLDPPSF